MLSDVNFGAGLCAARARSLHGDASAHEAVSSVSDEAPQSSSVPQQRLRCTHPILICDDEPRLVSLTAGLLREFGFSVLAARSGKDAVLVVTEQPVDVVVLDVNLPGEDARDIVASIYRQRANVSVILSSGYTEDDVEPALLQEPAVKAFLSKPYTIDVLVSAIDRVRREVESICGQADSQSTVPPR